MDKRSESLILSTVSDYRARCAVLAALKTHCNAEKVWCVMQLWNQTSGTSYTICPIIEQIGDRTPEQYIADVDKAVAEFEAFRRDYVLRFEAAKTAKERRQVVASFDDYFRDAK